METALPVISIVLAGVAISVAVWQGVLARTQLDQAKTTNTETGKALTEIRELIAETRRTAEATRETSEKLQTAFDERIGKVYDQYVETLQRKSDSEHEKDTKASEMADGLFKTLGRVWNESMEQAKVDRDAAAQAVIDDAEGEVPPPD